MNAAEKLEKRCADQAKILRELSVKAVRAAQILEVVSTDVVEHAFKLDDIDITVGKQFHDSMREVKKIRTRALSPES